MSDLHKAVVRNVIEEIFGWLIMIGIIVAVFVMLFGLYMCDHYRWGPCPV